MPFCCSKPVPGRQVSHSDNFGGVRGLSAILIFKNEEVCDLANNFRRKFNVVEIYKIQIV
jgi:hypothetical protein